MPETLAPRFRIWRRSGGASCHGAVNGSSADFSSSHFQGTTCCDTGAGGNDEYVTTDEPFLTVTDAGPVGINIGIPQAPLHVNGDIRYNGGIFGPGGHRRLAINVFSAGTGAAASASNHSVFVKGDLVSTSTRGVPLTVLSGSDGSVVHSQSYDTYADSAGQGAAPATAIGTYDTAGSIRILNTWDQPAYVDAALSTALLVVMKSTRIAIDGVAYRGAFVIADQNGKGKLGEDVSNSYGGATQFGNGVRANASLQIVTDLGW